MSLDDLERVRVRLREKFPYKKIIHNIELRRAVDVEVGTGLRNYIVIRREMIQQGMIKNHKDRWIRLIKGF
jgi:hypothetical protein